MYVRSYGRQLIERFSEDRGFIQVVSGPRQVGKTTLILQVLKQLEIPYLYASADEPFPPRPEWIRQQWETARIRSRGTKFILVIDEIQKIPRWSQMVKYLWDADSRSGSRITVVLLGSAPLLLQKGLAEDLAGRFELLPLPHWSFNEMQAAFGFSLEQYIFYGGYPGAARLIGQPTRWKRYVKSSLIETTFAREVLSMSRVDKPALLKSLFELGCIYSGQIVSYTKLLGQLHDAGNTTTLAHYLQLLSGAGLLTAIPKYAGGAIRRRASSPKLQVYNSALASSLGDYSLSEAQSDHEYWGRLVESAVGAHLINAEFRGVCRVFYWRERNREVDFIIQSSSSLIAMEVKTARTRGAWSGLSAFQRAFPAARTLVVGEQGVPLEEFFSTQVENWFS